MPKSTPLLFQPPMVRAILNGTKTMTRRVVKDRVLEKFAKFDPESALQFSPYGGFVRIAGTTKAAEEWVEANAGQRGTKWRPSIFLPRWASRIELKITALRIERLNDITEDDAKAEGVPPAYIPPAALAKLKKLHGADVRHCPYLTEFRGLWEDINGDESWNLNPWTWVISFQILYVKENSHG